MPITSSLDHFDPGFCPPVASLRVDLRPGHGLPTRRRHRPPAPPPSILSAIPTTSGNEKSASVSKSPSTC